jgi:hypothetical protein
MSVILWPWATFLNIYASRTAKRAADATKAARIAVAAKDLADRQEATIKRQAAIAKAAQKEKAALDEAARKATEAAKAASIAAENSYTSKVPPPPTNHRRIPSSFFSSRGWIDRDSRVDFLRGFVELSGLKSLWTTDQDEIGVLRNPDAVLISHVT